MEEITTVTTASSHGFEVGDIISTPINNSFWRVFWHWLVQKDLKRANYYTIDAVDNTTLTYKI